jgi:hypothetical protein
MLFDHLTFLDLYNELNWLFERNFYSIDVLSRFAEGNLFYQLWQLKLLFETKIIISKRIIMFFKIRIDLLALVLFEIVTSHIVQIICFDLVTKVCPTKQMS